MKFPKFLKIFGRKFTVRYVDRIDRNSPTLGITFPFEQRMEIAPLSHENEEQILTTIIHEYLHGALHVSGLSVGMSEVAEETLVTMMTHAFEDLMPQLAKIRKGSQ